MRLSPSLRKSSWCCWCLLGGAFSFRSLFFCGKFLAVYYVLTWRLHLTLCVSLSLSFAIGFFIIIMMLVIITFSSCFSSMYCGPEMSLFVTLFCFSLLYCNCFLFCWEVASSNSFKPVSFSGKPCRKTKFSSFLYYRRLFRHMGISTLHPSWKFV